MISNATIETLNLAKDLEIEYNIKLLILGLIFIYSIILLYLGWKWEAPELYQKIIKFFIFVVPSTVFIFFTPLTTFYLFRGVSWEVVFGFLIAYYTYVFVVLLASGTLGGFTVLANLLGMDTSIKKMELKNK